MGLHAIESKVVAAGNFGAHLQDLYGGDPDIFFEAKD